MGFITREQKGSKFLNFKDGKIVHSEGGDIKSYDGFSGMVIDLDIIDAEYQGRTYRKIILFIEDPETSLLYELGFSLESGYGNAFCCIAPNVDWTKQVSIGGKIEEKTPGKRYSGMFIRQDDRPVKWFFTKERDEKETDKKKKRPEPQRKTIGSGKNAKVVIDFSARNDFYESALLAIRKHKIVKATGGLANYKPKAQHEDAANVTEPIDDLPF